MAGAERSTQPRQGAGRRCTLPAFVIEPWRRRSPEERSEGTSPTKLMNSSALAKRLKSPTSVTIPSAVSVSMPRRQRSRPTAHARGPRPRGSRPRARARRCARRRGRGPAGSRRRPPAELGGEALLREPAPPRDAPRPRRHAAVVAEQEGAQALPRAHALDAGILTGAEQITGGLELRRGNDDRLEQPAGVELGEPACVATVGLDAVARPLGAVGCSILSSWPPSCKRRVLARTRRSQQVSQVELALPLRGKSDCSGGTPVVLSIEGEDAKDMRPHRDTPRDRGLARPELLLVQQTTERYWRRRLSGIA